VGPREGRLRRGSLRLIPPRLHVVTPDRVADRGDFPGVAEELLRAGGGDLALHLRLRRAGGRRLFELARRLAARAAESGGWCVVNERVDVGIASGAQAIQLGARALPVREVRRILARTGARRSGPDPALGVSVHGPEEAAAAVRSGADYLVVGTVYPTPSHPGGEIGGPDRVRACAGEVPEVPVVAIGGVDRRRVPEVRRAGAHGAAVVRAVWDAPDPVEAALGLIRALREAPGGSDGSGEVAG